MELAEGGSLADMIGAKLEPDAEQVVTTLDVWHFVSWLHTTFPATILERLLCAQKLQNNEAQSSLSGLKRFVVAYGR